MIGFLHKVTRHEAIVLSFAAIHVIWEANEIKRRPPEWRGRNWNEIDAYRRLNSLR